MIFYACGIIYLSIRDINNLFWCRCRGIQNLAATLRNVHKHFRRHCRRIQNLVATLRNVNNGYNPQAPGRYWKDQSGGLSVRNLWSQGLTYPYVRISLGAPEPFMASLDLICDGNERLSSIFWWPSYPWRGWLPLTRVRCPSWGPFPSEMGSARLSRPSDGGANPFLDPCCMSLWPERGFVNSFGSCRPWARGHPPF
jgi:hypothetical protein